MNSWRGVYENRRIGISFRECLAGQTVHVIIPHDFTNTKSDNPLYIPRCPIGRESTDHIPLNNQIMSPRFLFKVTVHLLTVHFVEILIFRLLFRSKQNRTHVVLALWPRKRRNTLNERKTKFALTCNVQKVIPALESRSRERFENSFFSKFLE